MISLVCAGCGARTFVAETGYPPFVCPRRSQGGDHVLMPELPTPSACGDTSFSNPFLRFADRMLAFHRCRSPGHAKSPILDEKNGQQYRETVEKLADAVRSVSGKTFRDTPFFRSETLSRNLGFSAQGGIFLKDETDNPGGSHKGRHLFALMVEILVGEALSQMRERPPLAIASCGNAALAAAIIARAAQWPLHVFVPFAAEAAVVSALRELGAKIHFCEREQTTGGDPCYLRFLESVKNGFLPFCCQGPDNGLTLQGGQTLLAEALCDLADFGKVPSVVLCQVGGGALASSCALALQTAVETGLLSAWPRLYTVQTEAVSPLARAVVRIEQEFGESAQLSEAQWQQIAACKNHYMWPWESLGNSSAHGILDDETYDWLNLAKTIFRSKGKALTVSERAIVAAHQLAKEATQIAVSPTGSAGLAGLLETDIPTLFQPDENVLCFLTGVSQ